MLIQKAITQNVCVQYHLATQSISPHFELQWTNLVAVGSGEVVCSGGY